MIPLPPDIIGHAGDGDIVAAMLRNLRDENAKLAKLYAAAVAENERLTTANEYLSRQLREALR